MTVRPRVSTIIPVHNGARFLAEAVASVRAQDYAPLELIVVDDGSTDATPDVISRLGAGIRAVHQEQRGPAAARNRGLALVHGDLIAFLDADDLWPPGKLCVQVGRLRDDPALDVVLGRVEPFPLSGLAGGEGPGRPESTLAVQLGGAVFRKSVFARVGTFDESLVFSEDQDWFLRAREQQVRLAIVEQVTLLYRRHAESMTHRADHEGYGLAKILKASLDRRRAQHSGRAPALPRLAEYDDARRPDAEG